MNLYTLDRSLKVAGLPIAGISVGVVGSKSTWTVQWTMPPTLAQEQQAAQLIANFVPIAKVNEPPNLPIDGVLAWCATKLGVDPLVAALEVVSGITVKP